MRHWRVGWKVGTSFFFVAWADDVDSVRLYSTKSFKPLGTLQYHKVACQVAEFASSQWVDDGDDEDDDEKEKARRSRWLISGGKDQRPTVWELMDFNKKHKK